MHANVLQELSSRRQTLSAKRGRSCFLLQGGSAGALAAERDLDAMNQAGLRMVAKELGARQKGVSVAELKAACERAVWEQQQQTTLTAWMAGNARVTESAAAPPDSNPEHSGAGAVLGAVQEQQQ